jgi:hypothetical protein
MTKLFSSLALAAITATLAPQALHAQAPLSCGNGNSIMNGTYVASGTGTVQGVGPITLVGLVVYNGDGTGTLFSATITVNGAASVVSNVPASFTVNGDCTGFKTIGTNHYNFVISPDGSTITWIVTDTGVTMMGTGVRLKH